jgi:hypothetical protein
MENESPTIGSLVGGPFSCGGCVPAARRALSNRTYQRSGTTSNGVAKIAIVAIFFFKTLCRLLSRKRIAYAPMALFYVILFRRAPKGQQINGQEYPGCRPGLYQAENHRITRCD